MIPTCDAWVVVTTARTISYSLSSSSQLFTKLSTKRVTPFNSQLRQRRTLQEPYLTTKRYYSDDANEATTATATTTTTAAGVATSTTTTPVGERNALSRMPFLPNRKTTTTARQYTPVRTKRTIRTNTDSNLVEIPSHGMPWTESISEQYNIQNKYNGLFYMPFYTWQQSYMQQYLTNLQQHPVVSKSGRDMSFIQRTLKNTNITIRMHTSTYSSKEYKYIRCTTIDGGSNIQVYTSVWYPRDTCVPILGCDLLQFNNGTKTICIVDFQPITNHTNLIALKATNANHHNTTTTTTTTTAMMDNNHNNYTFKLQSIRNHYPLLQNSMTNRFYSMNDTYFSKEMLLGRCYDSKSSNITTRNDAVGTLPTTAAYDMVYDQLFPAYQQYVKIHVETQQFEQQQLKQIKEKDQYEKSLQQYHREYDTYSATHDPAHALLIRYFGQEFADEYVYDILFPSSSVPVS